MITLNSCPVCGGSINVFPQIGFAPTVSCKIMPDVNVEAAIISRYSICQSCHLIFQNPRMSDQELEKFYSGGSYRRMINMTDEQKDDDEMYRAKNDAKIIKDKLGEDIRSHLDIGCSRGFLLQEVDAKLKVGVEPDIQYIKVSGVGVYPKMNKVPQKPFDLVTAIHTLEHVSDPVKFLKDMTDRVSDKGHLVIEVPTWKSPGGPLRLPHLYHCEPDVLRLLCQQVGLKIVQTEFTPHLFLICQKDLK